MSGRRGANHWWVVPLLVWIGIPVAIAAMFGLVPWPSDTQLSTPTIHPNATAVRPAGDGGPDRPSSDDRPPSSLATSWVTNATPPTDSAEHRPAALGADEVLGLVVVANVESAGPVSPTGARLPAEPPGSSTPAPGPASVESGAQTAPNAPAPLSEPLAADAQTAPNAPAPLSEPLAADAQTAPNAPATVPEHVRRGQDALAGLSYPWQSLGFTITFHPPRRGFKGLTYPAEKRIEIFVDPTMSDDLVAHVVAHEIGHAVDLVLNTSEDRQAWFAARGLPPTTRWWSDAYLSDFASPSGDFAECFAAWAIGSRSHSQLAGSCAGTGALMAQLASG